VGQGDLEGRSAGRDLVGDEDGATDDGVTDRNEEEGIRASVESGGGDLGF
jgi:hypothetical protein